MILHQGRATGFGRLSCILGIWLVANASYLWLPVLVDYLFWFLLFLCFALLALACRRFTCSRVFLGLATFFLFSALLAAQGLLYLDKRLHESLENRELYVEGYVSGLPKQYQDSAIKQRFDFRLERLLLCEDVWSLESCASLESSSVSRSLPERKFQSVLSDKLWRKLVGLPAPEKLRLAIYHLPETGALEAGQYYRLLVKLKQPRSVLNFSGFDYERWLFANDYHAKGYVRKQGLNRPLDEHNKVAASYLSAIRGELRSRALMAMEKVKGDENQSMRFTKRASDAFALWLALSLGDRSYLSHSLKEQLRETGTAHLLAISGMHIGMVAAVAFVCFYFLSRAFFLAYSRLFGQRFFLLNHFPRLASQVAMLVAMMLALFYALLAGFSVPTQRALIMVSCYGFAMLLMTRVNFYALWMFSMLLVLMLEPTALLSAGFYLSFGAVFIIQWTLLNYYYVFRVKVFNINISVLLRLIKTQWFIYLALLPLMLFVFSSLFVSGFLANLLAIPLLSFVLLPLSLCALFLVSLSENGFVFCFSLLDKGFYGLLYWLDYLLQFFSVFSAYAYHLPLAALLFLLLAILMLLSPLDRTLKSFSLPLFLLALVFIFYTEQEKHIDSGEFRLQLLDVGQGLAMIVETQNHRLLYDTGPRFGQQFDAGLFNVLPALKQGHTVLQENASLDLLLLSHGDSDHVGGAESIMEAYTFDEVLAYPRALYTRRSAQFPSIENWQVCQQGQSWQWDGVRFEILAPLRQTQVAELEANNHSCVLKVSGQTVSVLMPGDIESNYERELLSHYYSSGNQQKLKADILVLGHHGSKTSSDKTFLQAVNPVIALNSAAYKSHFGHPHESVVSRLKAMDTELFNTANFGEIRFDSSGFSRAHSGWQLFDFARLEKQAFWRLSF